MLMNSGRFKGSALVTNYVLLKKDTKFDWTERCENAFTELKGRLIKAPILRVPQFDKEFTLSVDSLDYSIWFLLNQEHEGKQHPICFGGCALRKNELKWHITDKEGFALVESIQHYRHHMTNISSQCSQTMCL